MDTATVLAVGGLVIGGFGALATAISAYLVGRHRVRSHDKKTSVEEQKVGVEGKRVEVLERRIDLEHHEAIVQGYQDLIQQYQNARDVARKEVHDLRDELGVLANKFDVLSKSHEKCEADGKAMREKYEEQQTVIGLLQAELAEIKAAYEHSNTSGTPEATPAATTA